MSLRDYNREKLAKQQTADLEKLTHELDMLTDADGCMAHAI